jgi:TonB family protein
MGGLGTAAWFLSGAARMLRMTRRSSPATFVVQSAGPVRAGSAVPVPLAWGLWRPVVLLPLDARTWPEERLRSAILHEETHIQRHDLWTQALAQAACCLYWFHPVVWLAARELRRERESACDDAVLRSGLAPTEYAGHLMEMARGLAGRRVHALAMAEGSDLETRVRALLDRRRNRRPLEAPAAAAIAICGALVLAAALVRAEARPAIPLRALRQTLQRPVSETPMVAPEVIVRKVRPAPPRSVAQAAPPRQTIVKAAPVVTSPISGVVLDPVSARVVGCQVTASSIDGSNVVQTTRTDFSGAYKFDSLPRGQYLLRFEAPGFAPAFVVGDDAAPLYIKLAVGSIAESMTVSGQKPPVVGVAPPPAPQRIRVGGNVQPAKLISQVPPVYPGDLQQLGIEGSVVIKAVITAAGQPTNLTVVHSGDPRLDLAAIDAVKQWRYEPTLLNGEPVAVETTVTVDFKLQP